MKDRSIILVVDDQPQNNELLEAYLEPEGYQVICAHDGLEALAMLSSRAVDLILLDVMMPGMDGFEVARQIRQDKTSGLIPIILVTALHESQDRVKGIEAGCDDFISKPVEKVELLARVRSLLKVKAYHELMEHYKDNLEAEVAIKTSELSKAVANLKIASLDTIERLSVAAEYKDENTGSHIKRIGRYCSAIAKKMGFDEKAVELILYAAPIHDLGKIGIPDRILLKPAKLNPLEWKIMKQHTIIGAEILKGSQSELITMAEIIARTHHEKWDGSGYPNQLTGQQIPIYGRITAVADVFDAVSTVRPYKKAFSLEDSLAEIRSGQGIHFDPDVVDAFFAVNADILAIEQEYNATIHISNFKELNSLLQQYYREVMYFNNI